MCIRDSLSAATRVGLGLLSLLAGADSTGSRLVDLPLEPAEEAPLGLVLGGKDCSLGLNLGISFMKAGVGCRRLLQPLGQLEGAPVALRPLAGQAAVPGLPPLLVLVACLCLQPHLRLVSTMVLSSSWFPPDFLQPG